MMVVTMMKRAPVASPSMQAIDEARTIAMYRDNSRCLVCRSKLSKNSMCMTHLLPITSRAPYHRPSSPDHIMTMCPEHGKQYEDHCLHAGRVMWLFKRGLKDFAGRLNSMWGDKIA